MKHIVITIAILGQLAAGAGCKIRRSTDLALVEAQKLDPAATCVESPYSSTSYSAPCRIHGAAFWCDAGGCIVAFTPTILEAP